MISAQKARNLMPKISYEEEKAVYIKSLKKRLKVDIKGANKKIKILSKNDRFCYILEYERNRFYFSDKELLKFFENEFKIFKDYGYEVDIHIKEYTVKVYVIW